jgi:hypothetical protein
MAILVLSEEKMEDFGIVLSNFVVSIRGRYEVYKLTQRNNTFPDQVRSEEEKTQPERYQVIAYMCYYTQQGYAEGKMPFIENRQFTMEVTKADIKEGMFKLKNMFTLIYEKIAEKYQKVEHMDL